MQKKQTFWRISKHLMLKFIRKCQQSTCFLQHFKTSHVKVYLQAHTARKTTMAHFKTSHVKVYRIIGHVQVALLKFQNISC